MTEAFAFLFDHLVEDPVWLGAMLGIGEPEVLAVARSRRAADLPAPVRGEARLRARAHRGDAPDDAAMRGRYAELLGDAARVDWPAAP